LLNQLVDAEPNNRGALAYLENYWRNVLESQPKNSLALANMGTILQKQNRTKEALDFYYQAETLAADPERGIGMDVRLPLRLNVGSLYLQRGDYAEAKTVFEQVLEVDAYHPQAMAYLLKLGQLQENPLPALALWQKAYQAKKVDQTGLELLVSALKDQPNPAQFASEVQWISDQFKTSPDAQRFIGLRLQEENELATSIIYLKRWQQLSSTQSAPYRALAKSYKALNQPILAQEALTTATRLEKQSNCPNA
jgi:tetratricopeptide (TPR) repeat protein